MIVSRSFAELGVDRGISEIVFGILVVEDLYAILLIAVLTALAAGTGLSAGEFALSVARLGDEESCRLVELDLSLVSSTRGKFPFLADADSFRIEDAD